MVHHESCVFVVFSFPSLPSLLSSSSAQTSASCIIIRTSYYITCSIQYPSWHSHIFCCCNSKLWLGRFWPYFEASETAPNSLPEAPSVAEWNRFLVPVGKFFGEPKQLADASGMMYPTKNMKKHQQKWVFSLKATVKHKPWRFLTLFRTAACGCHLGKHLPDYSAWMVARNASCLTLGGMWFDMVWYCWIVRNCLNVRWDPKIIYDHLLETLLTGHAGRKLALAQPTQEIEIGVTKTSADQGKGFRLQ